MKRIIYLLLAVALVGGSLVAGCAPKPKASGAAEFYKGKTITVVVASKAGGGFDVQTRIVAPYFEKYTGATAIIQNMPAGGGLEGRNHVFAAKPDGLTIVLIDHGPKLIAAGLFASEGVRYEWDKFTPLGKVMHSTVAFFVDKKYPWEKPEDVIGEEFLAGASRPFYEPLFAEALGWEGMRVVPGMSTPERALAIRRGEIQAAVGGATVLIANPDLLNPLVVTVRDDKLFPGIPGVKEVALSGREKWADYLEAWDQIMYSAYATPGIPEERVRFLEDALRKTWADPDFLKDLEKIKMNPPPEFITTEQLRQQMDMLATLSPDEIEEMRHVIMEKYVKK